MTINRTTTVVPMLFDVPSDITFEQAIALTHSLVDSEALSAIEPDKTSVASLVATIRALVASENGARGFFVVYLSDDRPLSETAIAALIEALESAPDIVSPLLIKNLAMSTAMVVAHRRNQDDKAAQAAKRTQERTRQLLAKLALLQLQDHAYQLLTSIDTDTGSYVPFLVRWGYDGEQREAIRQTLEQTSLISPSSTCGPGQPIR